MAAMDVAMETEEEQAKQAAGARGVDGSGSGAEKLVGNAGVCAHRGAAGDGGMADPGASACGWAAADATVGGGDELPRKKMAVQSASASAEGWTGPVAGQQANPAATRADAVIVKEKIDLVSDVREFWVLKSAAGYPRTAAEASATVAAVLDCAWLRCKRMRGPGIALTFNVRNGPNDKVKPVSTGLVEVIRDKFDGWQLESLPAVEATAWRVWCGIEHCTAVKAFGMSSNFAREINWLYKTVAEFEVAGNPLSLRAAEVAIGYSELRASQALESGEGWQAGPFYGINLPLEEVENVVRWANAKHKEGGGKGDAPELRWDGSKVVSTADESCVFKTSRSLMGSVTTFIQSRLSLGDFEVDNSEGAPGLALIRKKFGEEYVCRAIPSCPRGMADKGIVKVRIICELRFEKWLRSVQSKLVTLSEGDEEGIPPVAIGGTTYKVKFMSLQAATELVDSNESSRGGGGRGALEHSLRNLQAENAKAAAKLAEVLEQIEGLADSQKLAQENTEKNLAVLAMAQQTASADAQAKIAAVASESQARLRELAVNQAQAHEDTAALIAESARVTQQRVTETSEEAFRYSREVHARTQENVDKLTNLLANFVLGQSDTARLHGQAAQPCLDVRPGKDRSVAGSRTPFVLGAVKDGGGNGEFTQRSGGMCLAVRSVDNMRALSGQRALQWKFVGLTASSSCSAKRYLSHAVEGERCQSLDDGVKASRVGMLELGSGGMGEDGLLGDAVRLLSFAHGGNLQSGVNKIGPGSGRSCFGDVLRSRRCYASGCRAGKTLGIGFMFLLSSLGGAQCCSDLKVYANELNEIRAGGGGGCLWAPRLPALQSSHDIGLRFFLEAPAARLSSGRGLWEAKGASDLPVIQKCAACDCLGLERTVHASFRGRRCSSLPDWGQIRCGRYKFQRGSDPLQDSEVRVRVCNLGSATAKSEDGSGLLSHCRLDAPCARERGESQTRSSEAVIVGGREESSVAVSGGKGRACEVVLPLCSGDWEHGLENAGRGPYFESACLQLGKTRQGYTWLWRSCISRSLASMAEKVWKLLDPGYWVCTEEVPPSGPLVYLNQKERQDERGGDERGFGSRQARGDCGCAKERCCWCLRPQFDGAQTGWGCAAGGKGDEVRGWSSSIGGSQRASCCSVGGWMHCWPDMGSPRHGSPKQREICLLGGLQRRGRKARRVDADAYRNNGIETRQPCRSYTTGPYLIARAAWGASGSLFHVRRTSCSFQRDDADCEQIMQAVGGRASTRRGGSFSRTLSAGLGFDYGSRGITAAPDQTGTQGCSRGLRKGHDGSSRSRGSDWSAASGDRGCCGAVGARGAHAPSDSLRFSFFRGRSRCCCAHGAVWRQLVLLPCCGGCGISTYRPAQCMGRQIEILHRERPARVDKTVAGGCGTQHGHHILQLEMRSVVCGVDTPGLVQSKAGGPETSCQRNLRHTGGRYCGTAQHHHHGMCCQHHKQMLCASVAANSGDHQATSGLAVVETDYLPADGLGQLLAEKEAVDRWHSRPMSWGVKGLLLSGVVFGLFSLWGRGRFETGFLTLLRARDTPLAVMVAGPSCRAPIGKLHGKVLSRHDACRSHDRGRGDSRVAEGAGRSTAVGGALPGQQDDPGKGPSDSPTLTNFSPAPMPARTYVGRVLFWNARQLAAPLHVEVDAGPTASAAARQKLDFLERQLRFFDPWVVAMVEVSGSRQRLVALRHWLKKRGYGMVFQIGEGSSKRQETQAGQPTNGLVVAFRKGLRVMAAKRLAFRALAISIRHEESDATLHLAVLHGASGELGLGGGLGGEESKSFIRQLDVCAQWCRDNDGVLLADMNRVPCAAWREYGASNLASLSAGDKALRRLTAWQCDCCSCDESADLHEGGAFIGEQLDERGTPRWTRWGGGGKARLDVGVAFGEARRCWIEFKVIEPWLRSESGWLRVSDHAVIAFNVQLRSRGGALRGESRPMPVNLGPRVADGGGTPNSPWLLLRNITEELEFRLKMHHAILDAQRTESSQVEALTPLLRQAGEQAVHRAKRQESAHRDTRRGGRGCDLLSEVRSWEARLRIAVAGAGGAELSPAEWQTLFHLKTGLRRACVDTRLAIDRCQDWAPVIAKCQKKVLRAREALLLIQRWRDRLLVGKCQQMDVQVRGGEAHAHIKRVWRLVSDRKGLSKIQAVHYGDNKNAPMLHCDDPEFLFEAGRIGEAFVNAMDKGSVAQAFQAWLRTFSGQQRDSIDNDGEWSLRSCFTYTVYEKILQSMTGKAVGAGGLSVELLLAASDEVRRLFHEAILADVERGCLARHWKRILYVLLPKPFPNDPAIISQRREIALEPQDLKVLLQGLRWTAYARVGERLIPEQYGWRGGASCIEPSLALGCALNQARRLKHGLWVLYIDLANFFPAINREIACAGELHLGLPEKVADIMGAVYGGQRGFQNPMECQYETAAGLGAPFRNHMGRLMGCPVSPDSAKILLDSVLRAIKRTVKGLQLWPFEGAELSQIAYADDWCGVFVELRELKLALTIWNTWLQVVGAALGIKGLVKTVISGVEYSHDRALSPNDPKLTDAEGTAIPFLPCDEFYKHLGIPRSCDSMGSKAWLGGNGVKGIRDKLRAGVRRLRKVRQGSMSIDEFMMVSDVLLGCTAGFYLSAWVAADEELEQIEREWRKVFNRFACRDQGDPVSDLYGPAPRWVRGRTHLQCVGTAALFSAMEKAMSDMGASPAGAAVRSAVALALYQHGCRSDPNRWDWSHLRPLLECNKRGRGPRFLGDAWMLAVLEMEEGKDPWANKNDHGEKMRADVWGRWKGLSVNATGVANPLREDSRWTKPGSLLLFAPVGEGGLGLTPCRALIAAGVHELHQLCTRPWKGSSAEGRWLLDKKTAERRLSTKLSKQAWEKWLELQRLLTRSGLQPIFPSTSAFDLVRYPCAHGLKGTCQRQPEGLLSTGERRRGLVQSLRRARQAADDHVPAEVWERRLRAAFIAEESAEDEVHTPAARQEGKTLVVWSLQRNEDEEIPQWGSYIPWESPVALAVGWQSEARVLAESVTFRDGDGWPVAGDSRAEMDEDQIRALPPGPRLAIRARVGLGKAASVSAKGFGEKLSGIRVALDVQLRTWTKVCEIQARFKFTHAFTGDSSWGDAVDENGKTRRDEWGWTVRTVSAVTVSDKGAVFGGCLREDLPYSNYSGEIVALIAALRETPEGSRVLLCFDASSPVAAWAKFRRAHARTQCGYHEAELLAELDLLLQRMEVVYFWWFSSHCGAPMNEWPDMLAEEMRVSSRRLDWSPGVSRQCYAMWPARVSGAIFRWAACACIAAHRKRAALGAGLRPTRDESDWDVGLLPEAVGITADWLRCDKLMVGDAGHKDGTRIRQLHSSGCAHGCADGESNWRHYLFHCESPALLEARLEVCLWIDRHRKSFDYLGLHKQVAAVRRRLAARPTSEPQGATVAMDEAARRVFCGFLRRDACDIGSTVAIARANVRELICRCGTVAQVAISLEEPLRLHVTQEIRRHAQLRKAIRCWSKLYLCAGPLRVGALRQARWVYRLTLRAAKWGQCLGRMPACSGVVLRVRGRQLCRDAIKEATLQWRLLGREAALVLWFIQMKAWGRLVRRNTTCRTSLDRAMTDAACAAMLRVRRWFPELEGCTLGKKDGTWLPSAPEELEATITMEGLPAPGAASRHKWACRAFYRLGGYPKLRTTLRSLRRESASARRAQLSRWLCSWTTTGTCSGAPPRMYGDAEKIILDLPPRKRGRAWNANLEEDAGRGPDKRGRWAVDELVRARRRLGLWRRNGGPCGWEFLIRWRGDSEPSWEPYASLAPGLRADAKELIRATSWHVICRTAERTPALPRCQRKRLRSEWPGASEGGAGLYRRSRRVMEAAERIRKLETALVVYRPPGCAGANARTHKGGYHEIQEILERLIIDNEPYVRVKWKYPAPGDPEVIHFAWLSEDLQDTLLAAHSGSGSSVVSLDTQ